MTRAHRDWGGLPDDKKSGYRELGPAPFFALPVGLRIWLNEPVVFSNPVRPPAPRLLPTDDKLVRLPPSILGKICLVGGLRYGVGIRETWASLG